MKIVISIFSIIAGSLLLGCRYLARFHTTEEAFEYVNNIFHDNLINFNTNYTAEEKFSHRVWTFNLKDYPDLVFKVISMKEFYNERDGITSSLNIDVSSVLIEQSLTDLKKIRVQLLIGDTADINKIQRRFDFSLILKL